MDSTTPPPPPPGYKFGIHHVPIGSNQCTQCGRIGPFDAGCRANVVLAGLTVPVFHSLESSVYILCSENLDEGVGTAFVISKTTVLTAHHNMVTNPDNLIDEDAVYVEKGKLVKRLKRNNGALEAVGVEIPVEIKMHEGTRVKNFPADWIMLVRTDGLEFPANEIVEICSEAELPQLGDELCVYHCPFETFNARNFKHLGVMMSRKHFGFIVENEISIQNGLYSGSSGGVYALENGKVVAMHSRTAKITITHANPGNIVGGLVPQTILHQHQINSMIRSNIIQHGVDVNNLTSFLNTELEDLANVSDQNSEIYASMAVGVILCKYPDIDLLK